MIVQKKKVDKNCPFNMVRENIFRQEQVPPREGQYVRQKEQWKDSKRERNEKKM